MKVYIKIWCMFLIATLLFLGAGLGINLVMQQQYNADLRRQFHSRAMAASDVLEHQLSDVDTQVLTLSVSGQTNLFSLYQPDKDWGLIYEKSNLLYQQLMMLRQSSPYIHSTYLLFPSLDRQITDRTRYEKLDQAFYDELLAAEQAVYLKGDSLFLFSMLSGNQINRNGAIVGIEISLSELMEHCIGGIMSQMQVGLYINGDMATPWAYGFCPDSEQWIPVEDGYLMSAPVLLTTRSIPIRLAVYLPDTQLQQMAKGNTIWNVLLMLLTALELVLFTWLLKRIVATPLKRLLDSFDAVAQGDTKLRIHQDTRDEFTDIYHHFNTSVEKLDTLLMQEYQARMAAQHAEIKHLQAQIQPHFLYNSFYQLYRICRMEGSDEAAQFSLLLSGYYEYITRTNSSNSTVTLAEEIEHTRKYIRIQQFRYGERLNVCFQLNEDSLGIAVPKLVLQPVVENAIKYCVENDTASQLTIRLRVTFDPKQTQLLIEDNGQTLSDADIARQNALLDAANSALGGSGLINVHLRLKLSGHSDGVHLSRSELGGLCVRMIFQK